MPSNLIANRPRIGYVLPVRFDGDRVVDKSEPSDFLRLDGQCSALFFFSSSCFHLWKTIFPSSWRRGGKWNVRFYCGFEADWAEQTTSFPALLVVFFLFLKKKMMTWTGDKSTDPRFSTGAVSRSCADSRTGAWDSRTNPSMTSDQKQRWGSSSESV